MTYKEWVAEYELLQEYDGDSWETVENKSNWRGQMIDEHPEYWEKYLEQD